MRKIIIFLWIIATLMIIASVFFDPASGQELPPGFPTMSSTSWSATPTLTIFTPTPQPTGTPTMVPTVTPTVQPIITLQPRREYQVFVSDVRKGK